MLLSQQQIEGIGMTSQRTRARLVSRLRDMGISDERVLIAMAHVPRHLFIDEALQSRAYENTALPIGYGQTISQPYIVARMTQSILTVERLHNVLEVGTGSGYQAALLSQLIADVYTVERINGLRQKSSRLFRALEYRNIHTTNADGGWGWPAYAPFDAIIVTAAPEQIPESLLAQLAVGGKLVIPVGKQGESQALVEVERHTEGFTRTVIEQVSFVPFLSGKVSSA